VLSQQKKKKRRHGEIYVKGKLLSFSKFKPGLDKKNIMGQNVVGGATEPAP